MRASGWVHIKKTGRICIVPTVLVDYGRGLDSRIEIRLYKIKSNLRFFFGEPLVVLCFYKNEPTALIITTVAIIETTKNRMK